MAKYQKAPIPTPDLDAKEKKALEGFFNVLNFIGRSDRLANPPVNALAVRVHSLFKNGMLLPVINTLGEFPFTTFVLVNGRELPPGLIMVPPNFLTQLSEEFVFQVGTVVYSLAQADLSLSKSIPITSSDQQDRIAMAYEAESFLALEALAQKERLNLIWDDVSLTVIERYPQGVKSNGIASLLTQAQLL